MKWRDTPLGKCGLCGGTVVADELDRYYLEYHHREPCLRCCECGAIAEPPVLVMKERRKGPR